MTIKSALSLKSRALRLLSQREHSRRELERKLARHEQEPGSLARALDELAAKDFISEQRVAASVVNRRANKLGAMRVRAELQAKGLAPELVAQTVAELRGTELERAMAVWRSKFRRATAKSIEQVAAQATGQATGHSAGRDVERVTGLAVGRIVRCVVGRGAPGISAQPQIDRETHLDRETDTDTDTDTDVITELGTAADDRSANRSRQVVQGATDKSRAKEARFLAARGFSPDVIATVLRAKEGESDPAHA